MEIPLLRDILIIFSLSCLVLLLCHRLKLPTIVGYLITGVVAGPGGFALIKGIEDVETLSQIGIVLLLFTVGLEFSVKKIFEYKRYFFIGGFLQVLLTTLATFLIFKFWGSTAGESLFYGFLVSLSSTAIILKLLQQKNESATPHGRAIIGILVFQDVIAIPMMLLTPLLGGETINFDINFLARALGGLTLLAGVFFGAISVIPRILDVITRTRSRELFLLSVLVICFSVAYLSSLIGLSLSIGAFLAGLIISDSEYSTEAIGDILPFRDIFTSFFFVSIGMLLNVQFVIHHPMMILSLLGGIILLKAITGSASVLALGMPLRVSVLTGFALAQIGEFSLVLAKTGREHTLLSDFSYQMFLDVAVLSMALAPTLVALAEPLAQQLLKLPLPVRIKSGLKSELMFEKISHTDHVIIAGYGISGKNIARSSKEAGISYVVLEMNSETVKKEKKAGVPILFGDATHESVLAHAGIHSAKVLAVVINDPLAALRCVEVARRINPSLFIVARTQRIQEMNHFYKMGASDVIPDEFGTSVEIFTRVLRQYQIPGDEIEKLIASFRQEGYEMLREYNKERMNLRDFDQEFSQVKLETYKVSENSPIIGKSLIECQLRQKYGLTLMLIKRGNLTLLDIDPATVFELNDRVVVMGTKTNLDKAYELFSRDTSHAT